MVIAQLSLESHSYTRAAPNSWGLKSTDRFTGAPYTYSICKEVTGNREPSDERNPRNDGPL